MIADAAYFRAEKRGFEAGHEIEDWLAAEAELRARKSSTKTVRKPTRAPKTSKR